MRAPGPRRQRLDAIMGNIHCPNLVGRPPISFPACCSARRTSYTACRFIQNCGFVPEPVREPQGCVARDRALAVDDLADAVGRDADLPRQIGRADAEFLEFFGQDLAGMNGCASRLQSPFSVIVHDLDVRGAALSVGPFEAGPKYVRQAQMCRVPACHPTRNGPCGHFHGNVLARRGVYLVLWPSIQLICATKSKGRM